MVLAGLLVVSSTEAVPVEQFLKLSQEQHRIQHSGEYSNPKWFIPNTLKYYVLLHDMCEGDEQRYWKKRRVPLNFIDHILIIFHSETTPELTMSNV